MRRLLHYAGLAVLGLAGLSVIATAVCSPWNTDPQRDQSAKAAEFYQRAYAEAAAREALDEPSPAEDTTYSEFARKAAERARVPELAAEFVRRFQLEDKRVLDVGSGNGLLQDTVADYTGLDLSASARRYYHKPFIEASATGMPLPDSTFDALWSIWVLEHIPNPERALAEMRRVLKPGGVMFLMPALEVSRFAGRGYEVRPYAELSLLGKAAKASIPVIRSAAVHYLYYHQVRALQSIGARMGGCPSALHFIGLSPDYERYWQADADATTSVSAHELYLWFTTRGDECLNCPGEWRMTMRDIDLSYLILKRGNRT